MQNIKIRNLLLPVFVGNTIGVIIVISVLTIVSLILGKVDELSSIIIGCFNWNTLIVYIISDCILLIGVKFIKGSIKFFNYTMMTISILVAFFTIINPASLIVLTTSNLILCAIVFLTTLWLIPRLDGIPELQT